MDSVLRTLAVGPAPGALLAGMNGDGERRVAEPAEAASNAMSDGQLDGG